MKKLTIVFLAAIILVMGGVASSYAKEPAPGIREDRTATEGNRYRLRRHRGGGGVWFGVGGGGYYGPRYYRGHPRRYYYAPPPPVYYYPAPQAYYAPYPYYGGGVVVVR